MDYTDLKKATDEFTQACCNLDSAMKQKETTFREYRRVENEARKKYFTDMQMKNMTNAMYQELIRNDIFELKVNFEAMEMAVKRLQNIKDWKLEILNTTKKSY